MLYFLSVSCREVKKVSLVPLWEAVTVHPRRRGACMTGWKGYWFANFCTGKLGFESLILEITNKNIGVGLLFGKHIARGMGFGQNLAYEIGSFSTQPPPQDSQRMTNLKSFWFLLHVAVISQLKTSISTTTGTVATTSHGVSRILLVSSLFRSTWISWPRKTVLQTYDP